MQLFLIESAQSGNPTVLCSGPDQRPLVVLSEEKARAQQASKETTSPFFKGIAVLGIPVSSNCHF